MTMGIETAKSFGRFIDRHTGNRISGAWDGFRNPGVVKAGVGGTTTAPTTAGPAPTSGGVGFAKGVAQGELFPSANLGKAPNAAKAGWGTRAFQWLSTPFTTLNNWSTSLATKGTELAAKAGTAGSRTLGQIGNLILGKSAEYGSKALSFLSKVPKLPLIGGVIETVVELPKIFTAEKGKGASQLGNSVTRIAATTGSAWAGLKAGAAIGAVVGGGIPGAIVGGIVGIGVGMVGSLLGHEVADWAFDTGKNKQAQQTATTQTTMPTQNPYAVATSTNMDPNLMAAMLQDPQLGGQNNYIDNPYIMAGLGSV